MQRTILLYCTHLEHEMNYRQGKKEEQCGWFTAPICWFHYPSHQRTAKERSIKLQITRSVTVSLLNTANAVTLQFTKSHGDMLQ